MEPKMLKMPNRHKLIKSQNAEMRVKMFDVQICLFAVLSRIALYAAAVQNKEKYRIKN